MNKDIVIGNFITVKELAEKINVPVVKIIGQLMKDGLSVTINDSIDFETAEIVADDLGFAISRQSSSSDIKTSSIENTDKKVKLEPRPSVVTIMGHVDHGKTTLLDYIRKTNVVSSEAGGITQNITAYQVEINIYKKLRKITFIDTPGHKAFSNMREHGSNITDIIVLVVAADDGVKPQTIEVIKFAQSANVPIIVALNKIDTPGANPENVKRQLADNDLVSEEWGGKTIIVPISAKSGEGTNNLLEHIILQSDLLELKANYNTTAKGVVIESHQQKGLGLVALVLVTEGILEKNDIFIFGGSWGKIRTMEDTNGKQIDKAYPSQPIRIAGIKSTSEFGEYFKVVKTEKEARLLTESLNDSHNRLIKSLEKNEGKKILKLILKAETKGTLDALMSSIKELENNQVKVLISKVGVGNITDSDADLAYSTDSMIIGFRVEALPAAKKIIENKKIKIFTSQIIYEILDSVSEIVQSQTETEFVEEKIGRLKILGIFYVKGSHQVIGGEVVEGRVKDKAFVRLPQKSEIEGKIESLQIDKTTVDEVLSGKQCGLSVTIDTKLTQNDIIEIYIKVEKKGN